MSWEKDLQGFFGELQHLMAGKDQTILENLSRIESNCFSSAGDDSDRFVKCMTASMKKLNKEEKKFEFRMAFFQYQTAKCFEKSGGDPQAIEKCKTTARQNLEDYFNMFVKGLN